MKIVFDTNVIVSFLISKNFKEELFYKVLKLVKLGKIEVCYSLETFQELLETIKIPKIQNRLSKNTSRFLADYKFLATKIDVTNRVTICRDPRDNMFLELVKEMQADYLISGDNDLLELRRFENTKILKPSEFIEQLNLDLHP